MNRALKLSLGIVSLLGLIVTTSVLHAGGWDNFKLRYFHWTSHFHNQERELADIRAQNLNPSESSRIDLTELLNGGPPKDGIPSIDLPQFDTAQSTPFDRQETVIGVVVNGEAKAYPFGIMNWHEIVNDSLGGINITISYCPLCDTIVVFERHNTSYGVSGKLYQSCLVMYDRADETLYSQPWALGIVGKAVNQELTRIPAVKTTLGNWLEQYPNSQILATDTGYNRNYQRYPYGSYYTDERIIFPVRNQQDLTNHPKAIISYVWESDSKTPQNKFSGVSHQFDHQKLQSIQQEILEFNDRQIKASWDNQLETVIVQEMDGTIIPSSTAFAFVYPAYFN